MRIDSRCFLLLCPLLFTIGCASEATDVADAADTPTEMRGTAETDSDFSMNDLLGDGEVANSTAESNRSQASPGRAETPPLDPADAIPQQFKDAPVRKVVQAYPDEKPHRVFAAKVLGKNSIMYHGAYVEYYQGGAKQKSGTYEYGKKVGEWTLWSKDGVVRKKGSYTQDKQEGDWYKHRADGSLEWIERYSNGLADGTWEAFGKDGKTPSWRRSYKAGKRNGIWEEFHADGTKRSERNYVNGELHGSSKSWFGDGQLTADGVYKDGKRHGTFRSYGPTGNLRDQTRWQHGKQTFGT